jgi:tetratricopeptide (TPR) repeat protein
MRLAPTLLAMTAVLASSLRIAHAQQPTEAERLYKSGQTAYDVGRYDEAIATWERSYVLSKLPALVFNIAQAYRLRGDCGQAVQTYRRYLQLDDKNPEFRAKAEGFIRELGACSGSEEPWHGPRSIQKPPADKVTPPPGSLRKKLGYGLGFAGLGVAGAGLAFGIKARSLANEVTAACARGCDWNTVADKDAQGRSAATTQFVMYGIGGAMLGVAAVLVFTGAKSDRRGSLTVAPHGDGAVVGWGGAW